MNTFLHTKFEEIPEGSYFCVDLTSVVRRNSVCRMDVYSAGQGSFVPPHGQALVNFMRLILVLSR